MPPWPGAPVNKKSFRGELTLKITIGTLQSVGLHQMGQPETTNEDRWAASAEPTSSAGRLGMLWALVCVQLLLLSSVQDLGGCTQIQ